MSGTQHMPLNPFVKWNFLFTNWSEYFYLFYVLLLDLQWFCEILCFLSWRITVGRRDRHGSDFSERSSVSWTVSGLRFTGHGCHGWSLVLWRKSSRFLPDLNYSSVKWDGEIDLPSVNILFGNGEVICRELVAVVKWYPGTALEGSYLRSNLHLLKLILMHGLYANLWTF